MFARLQHLNLGSPKNVSQDEIRDSVSPFWRAPPSKYPQYVTINRKRLIDFFSNIEVSVQLAQSPANLGISESFNMISYSRFASNIYNALEEYARSGLAGNPWAVSGLYRDEVRCTRVLAWFLDPKGGHGCGGDVLAWLLRHLNKGDFLPKLPLEPTKRCKVGTETCPDGTKHNRVDIEVSDDAFYMIIEVKIDAAEQPSQIDRYSSVAEKRSDKRPWVVLYLTPDSRGADVKTVSRAMRIISIDWRTISWLLKEATRGKSAITRHLAHQFAGHVETF